MSNPLQKLCEQMTAEFPHTNYRHEFVPLLRKAAEIIRIQSEALEFYADEKNWLREPSADIARRIDAIDCSAIKGYSEFTGGRLAREVLAEILSEGK